jgi:SAM-dependent methyltransferase
MPIESGQVDIAYCEGVLQHTRDSERAVRELCRVTASSGRVLATHYELPSRLRGRLRHAVVTRVRSRISRLEREKLLLLTGNLAALSYVPGLGKVITRIGLATRSDIMPSFRVTWTNTFDTFGRHAYQRHIGPADLLQYFGGCRDCVVEFRDGTVVRVQVFGDSR